MGANYLICNFPRFDGENWVNEEYWKRFDGTYYRRVGEGKVERVPFERVPTESEHLAAVLEYRRLFPSTEEA